MNCRRSTLSRIVGAVVGAAFTIGMGASGDAGAQSTMSGVPNAMQGFSQNRDQPIQIEAASLEMPSIKSPSLHST